MKSRKVRLGILGLGTALGISAVALAAAQNQNGETIGQHFLFQASALPPPYATPADAERSKKAEDPNLGKL